MSLARSVKSQDKDGHSKTHVTWHEKYLKEDFDFCVVNRPSSQSLQQISACSPQSQSRPMSALVDSDGDMTPTNTPTPSMSSTTDKQASAGCLFLTFGPTPVEPLIVHPGAIIAILHLVPGICYPSDLQVHFGS